MTAQPPRGMGRFIVIWAGQFISLIGSGLSSFALAVWIFEASGQALPFALAVLLGSLPRVLLAPLAGVLADRWNRRLVMVLADSGSALLTLVSLLLYSSGQLAIWHIYLLAVAGAVCRTFQEPAYSAAIAILVPKEQLGRAAGLSQLTQAIESLAVPPLAGLLFVTVGMGGIFTLDLISFVFAISALLVTPIPQPATPAGEALRAGLLHEMGFGWRYLAERPGLFLMLWYFALVNLLMNTATVLTAPLVLSFSTADTLGLVQMFGGAGLLVGSVVASLWAGPRRRVPVLIGSLATSALGLLVVGLRPSLLVVGGGFFLMLLTIPTAASISQAIFQRKVPPALQGRVFATRTMISQSMMPIGFLGAGLLADRIFEPLLRPSGLLAATPLGTLLGVGPGRGIGLMFVICGLLLLLVSGLALAAPRLRRLEDELPDYDALPAEQPTPSATPAPSPS